MNTVNVHLIFFVNLTKSHGTSFIKQKYLTEITDTLINIYILIIPSQTVIGKMFAKPLAKGFRKPWLATKNKHLGRYGHILHNFK